MPTKTQNNGFLFIISDFCLRKQRKLTTVILGFILTGIIAGNTYEFVRKKKKALRAHKEEEQILQAYIRAENKSDIYNFKEKFSSPDNYDFKKIKKYWDLIGFMRYAPYLMFRYTPNIRASNINTNDMGFRGKIDYSHLPSVKKEEGLHYIVLLGGSLAFGAYSSSDEKCISALLEKKLNDEFSTGKKFRVINLGMGFYNSFQELISYMLYGLKFQPELIITLDGFNDCMAPLAPGIYYAPEKVFAKINKKYMKGHLRKLYPNLYDERGEWHKESRFYEQDVTELYKRNLDLLCIIATKNGAKILLTLQPIKVLPSGKMAWENKKVQCIYKLLPAVLEELSLKYRTAFVDFQKIFEENLSFNQYFVADPIHLTDRGQEIIATYLLEEAKKLLSRN